MKLVSKIFIGLFALITFAFFTLSISSCGKTTGNAVNLNIQYQVLNLSPDMNQVDLYIDFKQVNVNHFVFAINQGYFYIPSTDTPFQIRSALGSKAPIFNVDSTLAPHGKYSLFITGTVGNNQLYPIFTLDTAIAPSLGHGKIRFLNASPTELGGLDITANGTTAFSAIKYPICSKYIEIPAGNYDFQINETGAATIAKELPSITIQDGRLYTIYAYGYINRTDSAAFSASVITNK